MDPNIIFGWQSGATEMQVLDSRTLSENGLNTRPAILCTNRTDIVLISFGT
ncbi:unnamed protein product [Penicillium roqueforti FM164]|uniref:Uncharacterized protein n=1 Tax=Penicillium roqueforti (strain FM164) TaxID=1365484 RepID=W6QKG0_PENRF|nr:unnamed protein product [Penicillium roqueforti FM164]